MQLEFLKRDEVHLWTIERDREVDLALLSRCLSPEERRRADRLKVPQRREAFLYNRAMLRRILACYAGLEPSEVPLTVTASGKPVWNTTSLGLSFNLTHHQDLAILAVSQQRAVGVDVESIDLRTDYLALASQALSARELRQYEQLSIDERPAAMLRAWTRKEAFLKATGEGLGRPLAEIEVTFLKTEHPQILTTGDPSEPASAWLLESWSPRPGWFAALATPRESGSLHLRFHCAASLGEWAAERYDDTRSEATSGSEKGAATCGMNIAGSSWRELCMERPLLLPDHPSMLMGKAPRRNCRSSLRWSHHRRASKPFPRCRAVPRK